MSSVVMYDDEEASYISATDYRAMLEASGFATDDEVAALRLERQTIVDEHNRLKDTVEDQQDRFARERGGLTQQLRALEAEMRDREAQIAHLAVSEADAVAQAAHYQSECQRLSSQVRRVGATPCTRLQHRPLTPLPSLIPTLTPHPLQIEARQGAIQALQVELRGIETSLDRTQAEKDDLCVTYNARIQAVLDQVDQLQRRLKEQTRVNADAKAQAMSKRVAAMSGALDSLRTTKQALETQVVMRQVISGLRGGPLRVRSRVAVCGRSACAWSGSMAPGPA